MTILDTLTPEARKECDYCLTYIVDAYTRMSTNRDALYRAQQMQVVENMLERMTRVLEDVGNYAREASKEAKPC